MWTESDEGLLEALILKSLLKNGETIAVQSNSFDLSPGEFQIALTSFVQQIYNEESIGPHSHFRLRSKWEDPARAIALLPITLTVNLISRSIAKSRHVQPGSWVDFSSGLLAISNQRLLLLRRNVRPWSEWTSIDYRSVDDIRLDADGVYLEGPIVASGSRLRLPAAVQAWCYVAMRFYAFGDREATLKVPRDFMGRLGATGRTLDGAVTATEHRLAFPMSEELRYDHDEEIRRIARPKFKDDHLPMEVLFGYWTRCCQVSVCTCGRGLRNVWLADKGRYIEQEGIVWPLK